LKLEPFVSAGRPLITAYGAGGFRFGLQSGDLRLEGPVLVLAETPVQWGVQGVETLTESDFDLIRAKAHELEFLLLGTGDRHVPPPAFLRTLMRDAGLGLEVMDSVAACRAYNHLVSEGRHFAAGLLPVGALVG
jgi:uncharacterized protein